MRQNEVVDLTVERRHTTPKAVLIFDGDKEVWVPLSFCEIEEKQGSTIVLTVPTWFAKKEGLI
jgi:hypothetical protein